MSKDFPVDLVASGILKHKTQDTGGPGQKGNVLPKWCETDGEID